MRARVRRQLGMIVQDHINEYFAEWSLEHVYVKYLPRQTRRRSMCCGWIPRCRAMWRPGCIIADILTPPSCAFCGGCIRRSRGLAWHYEDACAAA
jgi:hypothetical protein